MKKQMIAGLLLLVLTVSGCSAPAPTEMNEPVKETRAEAETERTDSIFPSESKETDAPVESEAPEEKEKPESTAVPETATPQLTAEEAPKAPEPAAAISTKGDEQAAATVSSESKQPAAETTPAPTEQPQAAQQEPQAAQQPTTETPPPAQPTAAPEETKPKTAYDYAFDIEAIKADCIGIGQSMGLSLDSSLTPDNAAWWNPVTASQSCQGEALKQSLVSYITFHTAANLGSYGMDEITDFNIYCEARGNGEYSIYFLFA